MTPDFNPEALTAAMMTARDGMALLFDTADGMRADLERRGWSPTMAEQVVATWLTNIIAGSMNGGGR